MARMGFCSARDRNVPVILREAAVFGRVPSPSDAEALICLEYGVRCTGMLCPLFSVDPQPRPMPEEGDPRGAPGSASSGGADPQPEAQR